MKIYNVFIDSGLVCKPNIIKSSMLNRYLAENNHNAVDDFTNADFIIINSCGSTNNTQQRYMNIYKKYNSLKKKNAKIIMFGCLVHINKELIESIDVIDIGFNEIYKLDDIFYNITKFGDIRPYCDEETKDELIKKKKNFLKRTGLTNPIKDFIIQKHSLILSIIFSKFSRKVKKKYDWLISNASEKGRIFIEISTGCTGNCSFCVIKRAKGKIKSRNLNDIIQDTDKIYDSKKNIWLVADDCSSYGMDRQSNLIELIYRMNKKFSNLSIDLDYLNPFWLQKHKNDYLDLFRNITIDTAVIPIQSGSNKIIKKMNRNYDVNKVVQTVDLIKHNSPDTLLFAQLIIGYPGETILDFFKTIKIAGHFDYPLYYPYSDMKGTAAYFLPKKKTGIEIMIRFLFVVIVTNFLILGRLISSNH
ncbi:MAG: radical SAM protein [Thermoplasmatales archaeon]|nr:radical SAM protein [Thermoplasmatales archaeon]